jgi:hypothetical protein
MSLSYSRRKTRAPVVTPAVAAPAGAAPAPRQLVVDNPLPIMSRDCQTDLLVRFFTHHDRSADTPEQRAAALCAWLDAAVTSVPAAQPDDVVISATSDTPMSRR